MPVKVDTMRNVIYEMGLDPIVDILVQLGSF
jgi:hypothetical protein